MDIYRDYINAAQDMYDKYRVGADTRAVDALEYSDPISGKILVLKIYWKLKAGRSGPAETWSITLPRQEDTANRSEGVTANSASNDFGDNDQANDDESSWQIFFRAEQGILITAKTKPHLLEAVSDCREYLGQSVGVVQRAA